MPAAQPKAAMQNDLATACRRFREAIERCAPEQLPITMQSFPEGACGDAVVLLGRYLKDMGFGTGDYICGWRFAGERRASHAWLRIGGFVVDITADQFPEIDERVIVRPTSDWHDALDGEVEHEADFRVYDDYSAGVLAAAYALIVAHIS